MNYLLKFQFGGWHFTGTMGWIICALVFIPLNLCGQIQLFYADKGRKADTSDIGPMFRAAVALEKALKDKSLKVGRLDLLEIDDQVYAIARGRLDVFKWESGAWKNLYKGVLFGHNFYSKNFVFRDQLYSFGGYGFWKSHGQVIRFSFEERDWELVPCTQDLKYALAYQIPEGLRLLGNENIIIDLEKRQMRSYEPSFSWERFTDSSNQKDIEFDRFIYFPHDRPLLIIDKQTHQVYESNLSSIAAYFYNPPKPAFFHIYGDSLKVYNQALDSIETYDIKEELREKYLPVSNSKFSTFRKLNITGFVLIIGMILIFGIRFIRQRNKKYNAFNKTVIQQILDWKEPQISMADLDVLLNIHDIQNPDTLKFKRYQKIQEINRIYQSANHKMLIIRKKDAADKRRYIYEINK